MLDKLKTVADRYEAIISQLEDPAIYQEPARLAKLTREQKELTPLIEAYRAYRGAQEDMETAQEMMSTPDLAELGEEEYASAKKAIERLREEIRILLLPKDPNDSRNVIMEIRGGVGGEEAMLFAADLLRMYTMYADSRGWKMEIVNISETELGGVKEVCMVVEGEGAYSRLKYE
ncbi:MAG: PCRF domain-containing protein, partial [Oscillospiraceae bacterium]|nr:PCRF domain-containing protein [Oscillospiraceae bacterium]